MTANITTYCLEKITDYFEFERLCHDLMVAEGYTVLEPLGGFSDKGRDAIHVNQAGETTIFAYSVREDWRAKLAEDADKIHKHGHPLHKLVFVSTSEITAGQRDEALTFIRKEYGWSLDLYSVERLRILLDVSHPNIRQQHPELFPPQLYLQIAPLLGTTPQDHLLISYTPDDRVFADWLARKLTAEGYRVWCEHLSLLGGESYPTDVDDALRHKTFRVIALYSVASLQNLEILRQRALALSIADEREIDFVIPIQTDDLDIRMLDRKTQSLTFIPFYSSWASGFQQLLKKLDSINCPKPLADGKNLALVAIDGKDVLSNETELLGSNCFPILQIPEFIRRYKVGKEIAKEDLETLRLEWAFRLIGDTLILSFSSPPDWAMQRYDLEFTAKAPWTKMESIDGVNTQNLVAELLRKSLLVKCHEKGLVHCPDTDLFYFPEGLMEGERLKFTRLDGTKNWVNATGQRTLWRPSHSEEYKYSLAPTFFAVKNLLDQSVVLIRPRIRFTDLQGTPYVKRAANTRRKHLCKDWWNDAWHNRVLALSQFLADEDIITIGQDDELICISAHSFTFNAPQGIDEAKLDQLARERKLLSESMEDDDEEEEEVDMGSEEMAAEDEGGDA